MVCTQGRVTGAVVLRLGALHHARGDRMDDLGGHTIQDWTGAAAGITKKILSSQDQEIHYRNNKYESVEIWRIRRKKNPAENALVTEKK